MSSMYSNVYFGLQYNIGVSVVGNLLGPAEDIQ